jgi:Domain of unknown function (DUF4476)
MKLMSFLLTGFLALTFAAKGQGVLTVFSEDGDKFYLILNGLKQNAAPQTNVRVDGLTNEYYSCKVIFEDASKPEITKNVGLKDMATGNFAEATYRIKKNNSGEMKMRFFSFTPVPQTYNAPPDVYVVHYGQSPSTTVTQTTVTNTASNTASGGNGVNMNVGANGMNMSVGANGVSMNMNVHDPNNANGNVSINMNMGDGNMGSGTTTTTTTTTRSSSSSSYNSSSNGAYNNSNNSGSGNSGCTYPMDMSSFQSAKKSISGASFEETKMSTAKTILASNCVTTNQVIEICKMFDFENTKLDFAKFAYSKTTDKGNYFKVGDVFSFDASKTDLNNFIANGGR